MDESKKQLPEDIELTDDMLEGISGGVELLERHKSELRDMVQWAKSNGWDEDRLNEYLRDMTAYGMQPEALEAAGAYTHEIW